MGWTGDINVFAPTAAYNMDTRAFLSKWLVDLRDAQDADGAFPGVAPHPGSVRRRLRARAGRTPGPRP